MDDAPSRSRRILVVGGLGFYGHRVCRALRERGHRVVAGTRRAGAGDATCRVDLGDPATFAAFDGFDAVVNASDSVGASPVAAVERVLREGGVWFEMGADTAMVERLLALDAGPEARGTALVGVGVFPGISTALCRAVAEDGPRAERIDLVVRFSPLSGAGTANCRLMAESLFLPVSRWEGGVLRRGPLATGPTARFRIANRDRSAVEVTLPDTVLVHRATGAPSVSAWFALVPGWLRWSFALLAVLARGLRGIRPVVVELLTWQLAAVRAVALRGVRSRVELLAVADRGAPTERARVLAFDDGQQATALGVAAAVDAWARRAEPLPTGVHGMVEVLGPRLLQHL